MEEHLHKEHHHDHDHDCCHEEHHHHHDHDHDCCHEEHHHHHEEHHHHDHDHDHHHEEETFPAVIMSTHDNAIIGTVKCRIPGAYEDGVAILKEKMDKVARWVEDKDGLIGHIKAFVTEEKRTCMISIPEAGDLQVKQGAADAIMVSNANIVFGVDKEEFEDFLKKVYKDYL